MCGINGILRVDAQAPPIDPDELKRTRDAMASRGPDGLGAWISPEGEIGLCHRRLSIIDLSEAAAQPMWTIDGRYVVVFNGEIYNYRELRSDLESQGLVFRTRSDTEVLLALYARQGPSMLGRLRGMYAFAIWDTRTRRLLLARDPFGIKPLYYAEHGGYLRFASQLRALEASRALPAAWDPAGLTGFLLWGSVPEPFTHRRAIRQLAAGHWMEIRDGMVFPPQPSAPAPEVEEGLETAFESSVRAHLVADVPVGVFLSAGLDSTLVAALARRAAAGPITTITVRFEVFEGTTLDEGPEAAAIARALGTHHIERRITTADLAETWSAVLRAMDQPSIDGTNTYLVSQAAHEAGLKVALSGLGGDELLGGYPSFAQVPRWTGWARRAARIPGMRNAWPAVVGRARAKSPKLRALIRYGGTLPGAYFLKRGLFLPDEIEEVIGHEMAQEGLEAYDSVLDAARHLDGLDDPWVQVGLMETNLYMRNQLLRDSDWASMAHSLELRVPLVDRQLRAAVARGQFEPARRRGKRALVRLVAPELPEELLARRKSGFMVPTWTVLPEAKRQDGWGASSRRLALQVLREFGLDLGRKRARPAPSQHASRRGGTLLLAPEVFESPGGIQRCTRDRVEALRRIPEAGPLSVLVLNDEPGQVARREWEWEGLDARSFGRRRVDFALSAVRTAFRQRPARILIGHRGLLSLSPLLRLASPSSRQWLLTYGIETQSPVSALERAFLVSTNLVLAISPDTLDRFRHSGCRRPAALWPCSLPFDWEMPPLEPPRLETPCRLLAIARLSADERYKGVDHVIRAVAELSKTGPEVTLDVAGGGDDLPRLRALAVASGVGDLVTFHGRVSRELLRRLYAACDLFVLPSRDEGFGLVYLEAMSYGKPVVAAAAGGAPFIVRPGENGFLVPYGDVARLVESVRAGLVDREEVRRLGQSGREIASREFSFEQLMDRTRAMLNGQAPQ